MSVAEAVPPSVAFLAKTDTVVLVNRREAARRLGLKPQTLAKWACIGKGPQPVKLSEGKQARAMYRVSDLDAFIAGLPGAAA